MDLVQDNIRDKYDDRSSDTFTVALNTFHKQVSFSLEGVLPIVCSLFCFANVMLILILLHTKTCCNGTIKSRNIAANNVYGF